MRRGEDRRFLKPERVIANLRRCFQRDSTVGLFHTPLADSRKAWFTARTWRRGVSLNSDSSRLLKVEVTVLILTARGIFGEEVTALLQIA